MGVKLEGYRARDMPGAGIAERAKYWTTLLANRLESKIWDEANVICNEYINEVACLSPEIDSRKYEQVSVVIETKHKIIDPVGDSILVWLDTTWNITAWGPEPHTLYLRTREIRVHYPADYADIMTKASDLLRDLMYNAATAFHRRAELIHMNGIDKWKEYENSLYKIGTRELE